MADQRIELRAPLGLVDTGDGGGVGRVGGKPVDGLGREGDRQSLAQHPAAGVDRPLPVCGDVDDLCHGLPECALRQSLGFPGISINIRAGE
jgi:hypothetical protein